MIAKREAQGPGPGGVIGATPYQVALFAGLRPSAAQSAVLKVLGGEELTVAELAAWRLLTGQRRPPRPEGYREVFAEKGRRAGWTTHVAAPFAVSALLVSPAKLNTRLAPGEVARVLLFGPELQHTRQLQDATAGILDRLQVRFTRRDGEIDLAPAGLRTIALATVADHQAPRSGTAAAAIIDEPFFLPFDEGADGYDVELFAAIRPATATLVGLLRTNLLAGGSPWTTRGVAHDMVRKHLGKVDGPVCALHGSTWTWNETLSETSTRQLEEDENRWRREYLAVASESESAWIARRDVVDAVDRGVDERAARDGVIYVIAIDVAFRSDRFAIVVAHRELRVREGGPPSDVVVIDLVRVATPAPGQRLDFDELMQRVANISRRYNNAKIVRDAFSGDAVDHALRTRGCRSEEMPMNAAAQTRRWTLVQSKFRSGGVRLVDSEIAVRELVDLRAKMHAAGRIEVAAPSRRGSHDDVADSIALAIDAVRDIPATGGTIENDVRIWRDEEGVRIESTWFSTKRAVGGGYVRVPCAPPLGTPAGDEALEERQARGQWIEGDPPLPRGPSLSARVRE